MTTDYTDIHGCRLRILVFIRVIRGQKDWKILILDNRLGGMGFQTVGELLFRELPFAGASDADSIDK
ncbi:hypothetical protein M2103_002560 [Ereboglobus sp. PH5-5]|nr:hypothetical protein [Ereboglobus sp. PH5-5]